MNFDYRHYVPCLRWKQGEYQAVSVLSDTIKNVFTPIIEAPGKGYDFAAKKEKKTIDELLAPFARRILNNWGKQPCMVDLPLIKDAERMVNGIHPIHFVFHELRMLGCQAVPVINLIRDAEYQQEIKEVLAKDKNGACLRVTIGQAAKSTFKAEVDSLLSTLEIQSVGCDFILDLGSPNFVPIEGFVKIIKNIVTKLPYLNNWRTFTILGTSFPESMGGIKKGGEVISRYEWQLYKVLINNFRMASLRLPSFGDYAIIHPKDLELDWRVVKSSATIRYTIDDCWYIVKGENIRDYGHEQYHELSRNVFASRYYCSPAFSWGDSYIQTCTNNNSKTGNPTKWIQVGTNHHIEKLIRDIASFYAS
jgi:hypothetical protein